MGKPWWRQRSRVRPGVLYDLNKFIYLGSSDTMTQHIFFTRKGSRRQQSRKTPSAAGMRIGAQSIGHTIYITGRLFAFFLGLKDPRMVVVVIPGRRSI